MKEYVLGFYFDKSISGNVLLIEKVKPDWQFGLLNGLGGSVEGSELPSMAMVREFREECGLATKEADWFEVATLVNHGASKTGGKWMLHVFRGIGDISGYKHSCDEGFIYTCQVNSLPPNMEQTARWLLLMCADNSLNRVTMTTSFYDYLQLQR